MRPPGFIECYVCHKEFGSRSVEIHLPQCLQKWEKLNGCLPENERQRTPSPPPGHPLRDKIERRTQKLSSSGSITPDATPTHTLNRSWPEQRQPNGVKSNRARSAPFTEGKRRKRPATATLTKPKVLDISLRKEVDMSRMTRDMMDQLVLSKEAQGSSDYYSSDFTSSSPSSMDSKSPFDDDPTSGDSETEGRKRPSTIRLSRPSRHISVPVNSTTNSRPPRRGTTATLRSYVPRGRRRKLEEVFTGPKDKMKIPEPCQTCGKEENPERFHSHPLHAVKFKAKDRSFRDKTTPSKLIVTKPTALKYHSRSLDEASPPRRSKTKANTLARIDKNSRSTERNQSKSAENSPEPAKGTETKTSSSTPLRKFIDKQKASMKNDKSDFGVEIFREGKTEKRAKGENPARRRSRKTESTDGESEDASEPLPPAAVPKTMSHISEENRPQIQVERLMTAPTLICHICGREFGTRSLSIHQPKCLEKWKRENDQLPPHLQREEPQVPGKQLTREEWNDYAWNMSQEQLVPCDWCGRTFFPDRLVVHQRRCKPPPGAKRTGQKSPEERGSDFDSNAGTDSTLSALKPTVICYICGREFGSRSIAIHEPQCMKKWRLANNQLPPHLQKNEPKKPEVILDDEGNVDKGAMDEAAWQSHLETLVACQGCGRTFFPDRLEVHQKACVKDQ